MPKVFISLIIVFLLVACVYWMYNAKQNNSTSNSNEAPINTPSTNAPENNSVPPIRIDKRNMVPDHFPTIIKMIYQPNLYYINKDKTVTVHNQADASLNIGYIIVFFEKPLSYKQVLQQTRLHIRTDSKTAFSQHPLIGIEQKHISYSLHAPEIESVGFTKLSLDNESDIQVVAYQINQFTAGQARLQYGSNSDAPGSPFVDITIAEKPTKSAQDSGTVIMHNDIEIARVQQ